VTSDNPCFAAPLKLTITNPFYLVNYFVKILLAGFTKLHLSLMRLWMQAMTFTDTRIEKGQAEYTKPAKKICVTSEICV
jgi:hypothetical protein